ncbi:unnamed protein product [Caenorhabditis angaria]|uniref:DRBM domain-containing protein n=1 Tax=Caenorhabditis angaria TaxID=860376 RepID=A0A9P1ILP9_9PELO|nr:unnamed protein product [Caenorhabditis angaria]
MNKRKLPPKQYIRTRVGFVFQFGESTRIYNLLGPEDDAEKEWDCSPTEMKLRVHKKQLEAKLRAEAAKEMEEDEKRAEKEEEDEGCGWGMDYGENGGGGGASLMQNPEADAHLMEDREAYYNQDPRKALAKFFEREGFDMNFEFSEQGQGHTHKWVCMIELPVEIDGVDRAFTASATVSTSKKDAQTQCALEACRILDSYNVLRKSNTKLRMAKKTLKDNDYFEEDDDLYLDRTGQLEKQREKRQKWAEGGENAAGKKDTYESLVEQLKNTKEELAECQKMLDKLGSRKRKEKLRNEEGDGDNLDDYMRELEKNGGYGDDAKTKTEKSKWRQRFVAATHEMLKLEKLVKIAKPVEITGFKTLSANSGDKQAFLRKMLAAKKAAAAKVAQENEAGPSEPPKITEPKPVEPETSKKAEKPVEKPEKEPEPEEEQNSLKKRVADWEKELELEQEARKKRKIEENRKVRQETVKNRGEIEKKIGGAEDYGVGYEDRDEKYTTWMPPNKESNEAKQEALRAKFAGKY